MSKDAHLDSHNTWVDADRRDIKTRWVASSFVTAIGDRVKRVACIGQFDSAFEEGDERKEGRESNPLLLEYLEHAKSSLGTGKEITVLIRGGAVLTEATIALEETLTKDDVEVDREVRAVMERERVHFVSLFRTAGYRPKQMDIVWAQDNEITKIHYDAQTGKIGIRTKSCMEE